jgi:tetratricopeptide (TPR) repeat protein/DNA-binding CsgD family transcriptional regulator
MYEIKYLNNPLSSHPSQFFVMKLDLQEAQKQIAKAPSDEERLSLLLARSIEFYRNHPKVARTWAEEARKLARKQKNKVDEARAILCLGCASFQLCEYERTIKELESALKLYEAVDPNSSSKSSALLLRGMAYAEMGRLHEAIREFEQALKLRADNPMRRVEVLIEMANAAMALADYPRALEYQYQSLAILDEEDDPLRRSVVLSNIGRIYIEIHDFDKSTSFLERASTLKKEIKDYSGLEVVVYNQGLIAQKLKKLDDARSYFNEALQLAKELNKPDSEAYVSACLGKIELDLGKYKGALQYFEKSVNVAKQLKLANVWISSLIGLGKAHIALNQTKEGIAALRDSLRMSEEHSMKALECECSSALARAYEGAGKLNEAVRYFNQYIALSEELNSQQRHRALIEISARVEIEKSDRERARLELLAKDATKRANLLHAETERQSQELTQLALQLVQKNEFLCDLKAEIEPAIRSSWKVKALSDRIDDHIRSDRDWETFEHQFNQVHREFVNRLSFRFPALTPTELKIAVMIKLNLPTKAIANLFCLSTRTVENHRQSIRRKLKLRSDDNLVSYLTGFDGA